MTSERRLLALLERLFAIGPASLEVVLTECADLIATVIVNDKVDAFLYEAASETLVAVGTSHSPLGALQRRAGLHCLPVANGDRSPSCFEPANLTSLAARTWTRPNRAE